MSDPVPTGPVPRPTFHLTPHRNWMNDPNGLVHHRGLWHVYFQYNPEGADWGNMSWGHATSADLHEWTEHPVALRYREGEQIYSGSVVASGADDQLTAFYTSAYDDNHQAQSRATSSDGGFTWQLDPDNPVLDRGTSSFRDPKVIRFSEADGTIRWILLAVEADERRVLFYSSTDQRAWTYLSAYGPLGTDSIVWECPDLIPLAVDGDPDRVQWVLTLSTNPVGADPDPDGSSMSYVVGQFDGTGFTADTHQLTRLDHGRDFYAGVTFDSAPHGDAIMLGWMNNWTYAHVFPSTPWRGAMSLPRRLSLRSTEGETRLVQHPPAFITEQLSASTSHRHDTAEAVVLTLSGHALVDLHWDPAQTGTLRLRLTGAEDARVELEHTPESNTLRITRSGGAAAAIHPHFPSTTAVPLSGATPARLLLSLDGPLLELFLNDGEATASNLVVLGTQSITATLDTEHRGQVDVTAVDASTPA